MAGELFFKYDSVTEKSFLKAFGHNLRTIKPKGNIDSTRTHLNYALHSERVPQEHYRYAKSLIALAGIEKLRKNVVMGVEVVYSLPNDWHQKETKQYFVDCYEWTTKTFSGVLISFDVHLDESAPHAHAIILPLIDNKMQGDKLKGGRDLVKHRTKLYYLEVAEKYGFKYRDTSRINASDKQAIAKSVMASLSNDPLQHSAIYPFIRDKIFQDPIPIAQMLNIDISTSQAQQKHFVDICRSKGKGSFIK